MNAAEIDYYEQRSVTKFVLQLHLDALRIVPLWALKIKCSAKNDVMVKERETALRRQQEQDAVMTLRITKALIPDNHDASDGQQLVIVAGSKPKAATNNKRQSVGAAPLLDSSVTCCVRECGFLSVLFAMTSAVSRDSATFMDPFTNSMRLRCLIQILMLL